MNDLTGTQLGPYQLEEQIGSGSTGVVYRARQGQSQQRLAVKVIHDRLAALAGFRQALLAAREKLIGLQHQAIASVQDVREENGRLLVVSAWVPAESLGRLLQRQTGFSLAAAAGIVRQAAEGLVYAHRQGAVHGGIHPGNLLLRANSGLLPWQAVLTDPLLAGLPGSSPTEELAPYLPPERVRNGRINAGSDIYGLGCILFQLVTNTPTLPPQNSSGSGSVAALGRPCTLRPDAPESLERIILRATAAQIGERYRTMEELMLALRREEKTLSHDVPTAAASDAAPPRQAPRPAPAPDPVPPAPNPPPAKNTAGKQEAILISHPDEPTRQFVIGKSYIITIGHTEDNDVQLPHEGVADRHAHMEYDERNQAWRIWDRKSKTGTMMDGKPLLPETYHVWTAGQRVNIGPYTLMWGAAGRNAKQSAHPPKQKQDKPAPPPLPNVQIELLTRQVTAAPGATVSHLELELQNPTAQPVNVRLVVSQLPAEWVTLQTEEIRLLPNQPLRIPMAIHPPRRHTATAGVHTFQVTAQPAAGDAVAGASVQGQLTITPFSHIVVEVQPLPLRHGKAGRILVRNDGNAERTFSVQPESPTQTLTFALSKPQVTLPPGQPEELTITAHARKRELWRKKTSIPFELKISDGEAHSQISGELLAPPWISVLLIAVVALALLAVGLSVGRGVFCGSPRGMAFAQFNRSPFWSWVCRQTAVAELATSTPTPTPDPETPVPVPGGVITPTTPMPTPLPTPSSTPDSGATATPAPPPPALSGIPIGASVKGVTIEAYAFGSGPNAVVLVGGIHAAYAPASVAVAEGIIARLRSDPAALAIPDDITLYVVPNMNPDGAGAPGAPDSRMNANGVNLNNNWDCNWTTGARNGSAARSEPETQAVHDFIFASGRTVIAAIFWMTPLTRDNWGAVSPGRCTGSENADSQALANTYAAAMPDYEARQADPNAIFPGDATDTIASKGVPAVFVLLDDLQTADPDAHLAAIAAVLETYSQTNN